MSNPKENQTALAMAALKAGYYPWRSMKDRFRVQGPITTTFVAEVVAPTPIEALAAAAEALGLEPDPTVQQREQTLPRTVESIALKPAAATPLTLHRTMGEARGLIQTAIGQVRDLDIPHVGEYLWAASQELDRATDLIRHALASILAPVLAPKESTPTPEGRPIE